MFDDIAAAALEWFGITGGDDLPDAYWGQGEGMGVDSYGYAINGGESNCNPSATVV